MDDKVQELASKIYKDGIAKADSRAEEIVAAAEEKRDKILLRQRPRLRRFYPEQRARWPASVSAPLGSFSSRLIVPLMR